MPKGGQGTESVNMNRKNPDPFRRNIFRPYYCISLHVQPLIRLFGTRLPFEPMPKPTAFSPTKGRSTAHGQLSMACSAAPTAAIAAPIGPVLPRMFSGFSASDVLYIDVSFYEGTGFKHLPYFVLVV
jgi:hypothetical protein